MTAQSALRGCTAQLVPTLPKVVTDDAVVPFMNQTATLPLLSIQRISLLPASL